MARFIVEGIGFNDGQPFAQYEGNDRSEAEHQLDLVRRSSPRIAHRLVEVLKEVPASA